jgi:hypothetical protein
MIEVPITQGMNARATDKAKQMPTKWPNGILPEGGNFVGCLGEEIFLMTYPKAVSQNTYKWDVVLQGYNFEIKTKKRNVEPQMDYACSIPYSSTHQTPDFYAWVSLQKLEKAFVVGYISRSMFYRKAKFFAEGESEGDNGFHEKKGAYICHIADLWPSEELQGLVEPRTWPCTKPNEEDNDTLRNKREEHRATRIPAVMAGT